MPDTPETKRDDPPTAWRCASCSELNEPGALSCSFCASPRRELRPGESLPVSPYAKRAWQITLIGIVVNIVTNLVSRGADAAYLSATASTQQQLLGLLALALLVISRLGLMVVIGFALWFAIRAVPQTALGSGYVGRGRVIATFILCGVFILGLVYTVVSLFFVL